MSFILKIVDLDGGPVASDNPHSLHSDIVSVHFSRYPDRSGAEAFCYVREPVKTAEVPGFCEVEKRFSFTGTAFVMNENGKTISSFTARASGSGCNNPVAALAA